MTTAAQLSLIRTNRRLRIENSLLIGVWIASAALIGLGAWYAPPGWVPL